MRDIARRSLLAGISALPVATVASALPAAVLAHPAAAAAGADAGLIAAARHVVKWARLDREAEIRLSEAQDLCDAVLEQRPADITPEVNRIAAGVLDRFPNPIPDDMLGAFVAEAQDAARPIHDAHQAAMQAYRIARERAKQDSGHAEAERLSVWTTTRLVRSAEALTALPAQTWAGAVVKAQAFQAVQDAGWKDCSVQWRDDLAGSIVADVLRVGEQANV